jgi:hypothetical protein
LVVSEVVAVGEACTKDRRRRERSSISSPNVLGIDCRLGRRLLEHKEVASNVDVVVLEKATKVRRPKMVLRRLTMRKHGEQASRSGPPNNSNTPSYSRNVPPSLTSASTMDHHYPLHAISQQPRNRSTSDSNWSMKARWSPTSTSWYVYRRHRSRAAQLWAKVMRNAKPTFIDAGLNLNTALRRGGVLVQWLNRCTDSALSRCFRVLYVRIR